MYTKKLVFKGKRRKINIHQRAFKVFVGDPFAQYWCIDFGLLKLAPKKCIFTARLCRGSHAKNVVTLCLLTPGLNLHLNQFCYELGQTGTWKTLEYPVDSSQNPAEPQIRTISGRRRCNTALLFEGAMESRR